jgi:murein L,D-transpeptidase YcbB/YkuD
MLPPIVQQLPPASRKRFEEAYSNKKRPIAFGEHDDIVVGLVQAWLAHLGFSLPVSVTIELDENTYKADGIFQGETLRAVKEFQTRNGLVPDGMVGHNTIDKIYLQLHRTKTNTPLTRNAAVHDVKRPFRCPPGALICPEPPGP